MKRFLCAGWVAMAAGMPWVGMAGEPTVQSLIQAMDQLYRADNSYAQMEMKIVNPNWERTLVIDVWSQGMNKTFIRVLEPAKDRGVATLRVKNDMWNYFPKIDKVMKIPPSMMMGSWMGSDFTNDDLVKETTLLDDYTAQMLPPDPNLASVYLIQLTPKAQTATVWAKIILHIRKSDLLPVRETYYDEKDQAARLIEFKEIKELGGRTLPVTMELTPLNKPGNKTIITYRNARFNTGVDEAVFSLRNLQKKI